MIYQGICSKSYTAGTNSGSAGTAYPSESPSLPPGYYSGVNLANSLVFYAMLCRSLFGFFPFGWWIFVTHRFLFCLSFDLGLPV